MTSTWKATLRVAAVEAELLSNSLEDCVELEIGGLLAFEDPNAESWTIEAILQEEPTYAAFESVAARVGVPLLRLEIERLPEIDWVKKSLADLPPIRAGRFFVCGAHDRDKAPPNAIVLQIEANQAFGTGSHPTTKGCLLTLGELSKRVRIRHGLDLGCGSGILAFAMTRLWASPRAARVRGIDIDAVSVATAKINRTVNGLDQRVLLVTGNGLAHPAIRTGGPYELVVANILAGPLLHLAPSVTQALALRGWLVLSGLLASQEAMVRARYHAHGFRLVSRRVIDGWTTLLLKKAGMTPRLPPRTA